MRSTIKYHFKGKDVKSKRKGIEGGKVVCYITFTFIATTTFV